MTFQREMTAIVAHVKAAVMTRAEAVEHLAQRYPDRDPNYMRALLDYRILRDQWERSAAQRAEYETRPVQWERLVQGGVPPRITWSPAVAVTGSPQGWLRHWQSNGLES